MTTIGDHGNTRLPGMDAKQPERPGKPQPVNDVNKLKSSANRKRNSGNVSDLHDNANLRETVADLVDSGDLNATSDGSVRAGRVSQVREKTASGTYDDYSVLSDIVDRLLTQWNI